MAVKDAQLEASLPLAMELARVNAERYCDNKVYADQIANTKQFGIIEYQLAHKINGTLGLPYSSLITGVPKMCDVSLECTCGSSN